MHSGTLLKFLIAEPSVYTLAKKEYAKEYAKEYLHHNCQLKIVSDSYDIDVIFIYTSLPADTLVELQENTLVELLKHDDIVI